MKNDPMEHTVALALTQAGIIFQRDVEAVNGSVLDFYIPSLNLFIEVKQFASERTARQIQGMENVIVIQGLHAANVLLNVVTGFKKKKEKPDYNVLALQCAKAIADGPAETCETKNEFIVGAAQMISTLLKAR